MKHLLLLLSFLAFTQYLNASNTFPSSGNVGIGTTSPGSTLDVKGSVRILNGNQRLNINSSASGSYNFRSFFAPLTSDGTAWDWAQEFGYHNYYRAWYFDGDVGIGTVDPAQKLDVAGNIRLSWPGSWVNENQRREIHFGNGDWALKTGQIDEVSWANGDAMIATVHEGRGFVVADDTDVISLEVGAGLNSYSQFKNKLGIGTVPTTYSLEVAGTILAEEVIVESGWADFVFQDDYSLMPIKELGQFIDQERRLPGIPSEAEVLEKGVSIGSTQTMLLQKVEELTLYIVELNDRVEKLEKEIQNLRGHFDDENK